MRAEIIGWLSSALLVLTIAKQIHAQWRKGTSKGVSIYLFVGQIAASLGFLIYSALTGNLVFIVTNALMMASALVGLGLVLVHRHRASKSSCNEEGGDEAAAAGPENSINVFARRSAV